MVSTLDFESSDPSSNLGGTYPIKHGLIPAFIFFFLVAKKSSNRVHRVQISVGPIPLNTALFRFLFFYFFGCHAAPRVDENFHFTN